MDEAVLQAYRDEVRAELTDNILPFHIEKVVDPAGGFHGYVANDGAPRPGAPRGVIQVTRILWAFARAHRLFPNPAYAATAQRACAFLLDHFLDAEHGGLYWLVDAQGRPLEAQKMLYAHAFGVYALAEWAQASGGAAALAHAQTLFDWIEAHGWDEQRGGYVEGRARDGGPADLRVDTVAGPVAFSMNTHLHLLEAYATLIEAWPHARVQAALRRCLDILLERVIQPATGCFGLQFDAAWRPLNDHISYGHDIEGSWLLTEAAERLGDPALAARTHAAALRLVEATWLYGRDADGGLCNEGSADRAAGPHDRSKDWWPQAEAMVGFLNGWQLSGDARYLDASLAAWRYVQAQIIDPVHGDWFWGRDAQGHVVPQQKSGPWKGPYHNGRACMELWERLG